MLEFLFNKVADLDLELCRKENQTQVFLCEYCEMFNNSFFEHLFEEHLRMTASDHKYMLSFMLWITNSSNHKTV